MDAWQSAYEIINALGLRLIDAKDEKDIIDGSDRAVFCANASAEQTYLCYQLKFSRTSCLLRA